MLREQDRRDIWNKALNEAEEIIKDPDRRQLLLTAYASNARREAEWEALATVIAEYEDGLHTRVSGAYDERIDYVIRHFKESATRALAGAKVARDDMMVYLRAMVIVVESALDAGTHGEKNARLRGVIDVLERSLKRLHDMQFDFSYSVWNRHDVFRSDYPTRELMEKVHDLQARLAELSPDDPLLPKQRKHESVPF